MPSIYDNDELGVYKDALVRSGKVQPVQPPAGQAASPSPVYAVNGAPPDTGAAARLRAAQAGLAQSRKMRGGIREPENIWRGRLGAQGLTPEEIDAITKDAGAAPRAGSYEEHVGTMTGAQRPPMGGMLPPQTALPHDEWRRRKTETKRMEANERRRKFNEKHGLGPGDRGYKKPMPVTIEDRQAAKGATRDKILERRDSMAERGLAPKTRGYHGRQEEARKAAENERLEAETAAGFTQAKVNEITRTGKITARKRKGRIGELEKKLRGASEGDDLENKGLTDDEQAELDRLYGEDVDYDEREAWYKENKTPGAIYPADEASIDKADARAEFDKGSPLSTKKWWNDPRYDVADEDREFIDGLSTGPRDLDDLTADELRELSRLRDKYRERDEWLEMNPAEQWANSPGLGGAERHGKEFEDPWKGVIPEPPPEAAGTDDDAAGASPSSGDTLGGDEAEIAARIHGTTVEEERRRLDRKGLHGKYMEATRRERKLIYETRSAVSPDARARARAELLQVQKTLRYLGKLLGD